LHVFAETGYDLIAISYNVEQMIRNIAIQGDITSQADVKSFINQLPELAKGQH